MVGQKPRRPDLVLADPRLARVAGWLATVARPAIRLLSSPLADEEAVPVGATKLGGRPDLPPDAGWPTKGPPVERPLPVPFIGQVRLEDVAGLDTEGALPRFGLLSVFYDADGTHTSTSAYPHDFNHPTHCRVLWFRQAAPTHLSRTAPPPDLVADNIEGVRDGVYRPRSLAPTSELSLPDPESPLLMGPNGKPTRMTQEEWKTYAELWYDHMDANNCVHQLLGHASPNQAASVWEGYAQARRAFHQSRDAPDGPPYPAHWQDELLRHRLLMQVSDEDNGMWFGREGRLCLFINEDDLAARDYSRVWFAV
jgi:uncharacterized protein YwqG